MTARSRQRQTDPRRQAVCARYQLDIAAVRARQGARHGQAKADAYQAGVTSLGSDVYGMLQAFQIIADKNLRVVPDVLVNGGANNNGILDALMAMMTKQRPALPGVN